MELGRLSFWMEYQEGAFGSMADLTSYEIMIRGVDMKVDCLGTPFN